MERASSTVINALDPRTVRGVLSAPFFLVYSMPEKDHGCLKILYPGVRRRAVARFLLRRPADVKGLPSIPSTDFLCLWQGRASCEPSDSGSFYHTMNRFFCFWFCEVYWLCRTAADPQTNFTTPHKAHVEQHDLSLSKMAFKHCLGINCSGKWHI